MSWRKGQSGNPKGRPPKGKAMSEELRRLLARQASGSKRTNLEVLVANLIDMALAGQLDAIKYICDRLEGRPAQAVELGGDEARPITFVYVDGNKEKGGSDEEA